MANLVNKRIKAAKLKHKLKCRLLGLKGAVAYILKRDGREQSFITLATFPFFEIGFSNYRTSETIEFAVLPSDTFTRSETTRTMREIAEIATHIAVVETDGNSMVNAVRTGDEYKPFFKDATWRFFVVQVGDRFVPGDNE